MTDLPKALNQRPNIVYIHSHDTGRYVQPYGFSAITPAYQRLAEDGVVFRQAFSAAPTCSPSRAALLTGQSPHSAGMLGLVHRGFGLRDPSQHLAATLYTHGYRTVIAGTQHVLPADGNFSSLGFTEVRTPADGSSAAYARAAVEILEEQAASEHGPLFLDIGFSDTHRPFPEIDPETAKYVRPPALFPDSPATRLDYAAYLASLERLDSAVGEVLTALDRTGLASSTLVICTTDHGLAFPSMKCNLTDHGLGVLLIIRGPAGFESGQVHDALVSHLDIYPTICEVTGIPSPSWLQGHSLMPLIRGEMEEIREEVFGEVTYHAAYEPQRSIRTQRWTLIVRYGNRERVVLPNIDDSPTRSFLLEQGWDQRPVDVIQLYDNLLDPVQTRNVATEPSHAAIVAELHRRLRDWMVQTSDPLLDGPVPLPPGGIATDVDASSAESGISRA
jgi:arylsulfatase A-like enzyme